MPPTAPNASSMEFVPKLLCRTHAESADDEIVISGMSGKFPNSENVEVFEYNLYNKIDMVDEEEKRWRHFNYEIPRRMGKIEGLEKFDATFFGVHFKQAHTMDPQCRMLIESSYEAVLDAGINPRSLNGTRTGCFMAACFSESEKTWFYEKISSGGFGITGCSRAMLANRVSYSLGIQGPSFLVDTACSSSMTALDCAFSAIRNGECDGAIVGGANLIIHPYITLQFARLGALSPNGYCKPFTKDALGYVRSEAISVVFLQKAKNAKRVYGTLLYSKINCDGYKQEGITFPSVDMQNKLFTEFYDEVGIPPTDISYIEAHGTGTNVGDPVECMAIDKTFCTNRKTPLLIGSVKSNMGHSESASGVVSITKILLAFERGFIPPNINFTSLRQEIPSLMENRLKVCLEPTKLEGDLVAISSFGFGGGNAHCLLRRNAKEKKNNGAPDDKLPRLITWSGRTEEGMEVFFNSLERRPLDVEYVALLHNTQAEEIPGYIFRGYGLYTHNPEGNAICVTKEVQHYTGLKRPIVWVFSGMGSQWPEMGTSLLQIPLFRQSIQKCHNILEPFGVNLLDIITSPDPKTFDNIVHSFVGIASIQVAIVDILRTLNMDAEIYIGHSVGELGCAYADGCFTAEQMVLAAYSRGMASIETNVIRGSMAAVGLGYKKLRTMVPPNIDIACHNSLESSTISGPEEDIEKYVAELKEQGIFAKSVPCSNIAYHSRYIADMGPKLLERLQKVVPVAKKRSPKWFSSSFPKNRWEFEESQYSSAEYHVNNLLSSVLFEETAAILPSNALTIEIAPHGLLQAIIKKSMPKAIHFGLTQRGNKDNVSYFLNALGKLFVTGLTIPIERIFPPVEFPVSRGTPKIGHLVRWDHAEEYFVTTFEFKGSSKSGERLVEVALNDKDYEFIAGHTIDGRVLFPATGYLYLVWETLATINGKFFFDTNVHFEDLRFLRATTMSKEELISFKIMIHSGTGRFEISEAHVPIVTGYIAELEETAELTELPFLTKSDYPMLDQKDFYKELRLRGYQYSDAFRSVYHARGDGLYGKVQWDNNWVSFLDCLLQISIIGKDSRSLILPTRIQKIIINTKEHMRESMRLDPETKCFEVQVCPELGILKCGGIEIVDMSANSVGRRKPAGYPVLETYKFIPNLPTPHLSKLDGVRVSVQIALENNPILKMKCIEVDVDNNEPIIQYFQESISELPLITYELMLLTPQDLSLVKVHVEDGKLSTQTNCTFIIAGNCLSRLDFVEECKNSMTENAYLLSREPLDTSIKNIVPPNGFQTIIVTPTELEYFILFQRINLKSTASGSTPAIVYISSADTEYTWLEKLKTAISNGPVIAVAEKEEYSGIVGLVNAIHKEPNGSRLRCVFIDDETAPAFNLDNTFYKNQLNLGMTFNIYRNGKWGTYRHLRLTQIIEEKPRRDHCYANVLQRGDLTSLCWLEGSINATRRNDIINIQYASLNFRDIMLASGRLGVEVLGPNRLDHECVLGMEFSGVNKKGERIMGTTVSGAMANQVVQFDNLTWVVPDTWTLREAATCPIVYLTVYSAFFLYKPISKGRSILIHAGSGGVGLAAIRVALAYGMEVYTTVSTQQKKKFIMDAFPQLKEINIGNSRDCSFETMIKLRTKGRGVDYVLNSLAEDKLHASIRCLGFGGIFLEIGKFDLANDTKIGLGSFLKEISFRTVMVDNLFKATAEERIMIATMVAKDLHAGIIQPLHSTVFQVDELEKAYRYLGAGKHVGKVVIKLRENPYDEWTVPIKVVPRPYFDPDLVYVMPGGLGGFGLELADWMIIRGVRKIVLSSRTGISKTYQTFRIKMWESYGTKVIVNTADITTRQGCEDLLKEALKHGQVGGIFNLAMVLRDGLLENQTVQKYTECMAPKAVATKHFDELSRKLCPHLKYFVIFSSFVCGRGNAAQSNYAMANSVMERIIEQRVAEGLPGKGIQWGAIGDVGLVADMSEDKADIEIGGTLQQPISSCLQELDALLTVPDPIVASMVVAAKREGTGDELKLIDCILNIIGIRDANSISVTATLADVGMDSLIAVEIKQTLEREFEIFLSPQELRSITFSRLKELQEEREARGFDNVKLKLANEDKTVGLNILHKNLWTDEMSTTPLIRLKTLNNFDKFISSVIFVPGIEGVAGLLWNQIAASINLPAFVLQLTSVYDKKNVSDMVEALVDYVKTSFEQMEFFYLVGYSFGSIITLEIVRQLEELGMKGHVIFIDGSPTFVKKLAKITTENTNEANQNSAILKIIINYVYPRENAAEIFAKVGGLKTDAEKITKLIDFGKSQNKYPVRYLEIMIPTLFNRLNIMLNLDTDNIKKIKTSVTLIRPTEVGVAEIDEDYELSRFTEGPINIKFIEGNHTTMLENEILPQLINELDPNIESDRQFKEYIASGRQ